MRDTFADTTRARADLGFRAHAYRSRRGLAAECDWLARLLAAPLALRTDESFAVRRFVSLARCCGRARRWRRASAWRAASSRSCRRPARVRRRQVPVRPRHGAAAEEELDRRRASTSGGSSTPTRRARTATDAKLGIGDSYLGEGRVDSLHPRRQRVPRVPDVLPARRARRLRAVPAGARAVEADARRRSAIRRPRATRSASSRRSSQTYPNSAATARGRRSCTAQARDRLSESEFRVGLLYFRSRWYPGAVAAVQGAARGRPGVHAARRGVLLPGRVAAARLAADRQALPLLRAAARGVPEERVRRRRRASGWPRSSARSATRSGGPLGAGAGAPVAGQRPAAR